MIAAIAATTLGCGVGIANAQGVEFGVPGVHFRVGPGYHHDRDWRDYAYEPGCRVVVRHHVNRWGEDIVTRHRECD
jgi:hypothetical protein